VEISLEEEGAILYIREKSGADGNTVRCTFCSRLGHMASRCVSKDRLLPANAREVMVVINVISCFKCGEQGTSRETVDRGRTGNPADRGVAQNIVVRERR
jgi:hypothetical protein